jgi:hypothetical protein
MSENSVQIVLSLFSCFGESGAMKKLTLGVIVVICTFVSGEVKRYTFPDDFEFGAATGL